MTTEWTWESKWSEPKKRNYWRLLCDGVALTGWHRSHAEALQEARGSLVV